MWVCDEAHRPSRVQGQDASGRQGEDGQWRRRGRKPRCSIAVPEASDAALDGIRLHRVHGVEEDTKAAVGKGEGGCESTSRGST